MMPNKVFFLLLALILSLKVLGVDGPTGKEVIYGEDNRLDLHEAPAFYAELARSTAAMIKKESLSPLDNPNNLVDLDLLRSSPITLKRKNFSEVVCGNERFADQPVAALCTGFLLTPDLLVTAGHCARNQLKCSDYVWVFDFRADRLSSGREDPTLPSQNIYQCQEIVLQRWDYASGEDYAVIRLNRPVKDRSPLEVRRRGIIEDEATVIAIGHPSGLPTKIMEGAHIRRNDSQKYFVINSDSFKGSSGAPVIHAKTGLVEGILVRGEEDYIYDVDKDCKAPKRCEEEGCRGEDALRITELPLSAL